jgi:2-hydroxychromene-2-carboxylate isomerase
VAERHKATLNYKPVNLAALWDVSGAVPPGQRPPVRQRLRLIELQRLAEWRGLPIKTTPLHWPVDASLADKIIIALVEAGHDPRYFMGKVLAGCWANDDNIADEAVLTSYLSQVGLDAKPAIMDAKTDDIAMIRERNSRDAIAADAVMLSHERIWSALDALAERHGLTASGLARRAGLDPTAFNKSKRRGADGRDRWPSTESLAKVLDATGSSLDDFMSLVGGGQRSAMQMSSPKAPFHRRQVLSRCWVLPRPVPGAFLMMAGFRRARAGMWSIFRRNHRNDRGSMRSRCRATACCRFTAMVTS